MPAGWGWDQERGYLNGWDTHNDNFEGATRRVAVPDKAMSALLTDLPAKVLLDQTLVVLATEFGRTPWINDNDGWDHNDGAFTCLLAGAGIRGRWMGRLMGGEVRLRRSR